MPSLASRDFVTLRLAGLMRAPCLAYRSLLASHDLLPNHLPRSSSTRSTPPVYAPSAFAAVASLKQLGYDITKVTHCIPEHV